MHRRREDSPAFAYTIGNARVDLPELLMIGNISAAYLLNDLSQRMIDRKGAFAHGELVDVGGSFPLKVINVTNNRVRDEYTIQVGQHFGHENYAVQQVLVPDKSGRYPGDPACAAPYSNMPVLGTGTRGARRMSRAERRRAEAERRRAGKTEDKETARRMVMEDARRAGRARRELMAKEGITADALTFDDPMPVYEDGGAGTMINLVIGTRDDLSTSTAEAAAHKWREIRHQYPNAACIYLCLLGYDQDPREIYEIDSAAAYVCLWAQLAGITDFEKTVRGPIGPVGAAFLAACGAFGEEIRRQVKVPPATAKH